MYECISQGGEHKLGGYPFFTQEEPREDDKFDILLFQLNSEAGIMWGDMGIGNFFINSDDLRKKNFDNVLYNWDCY